MTIAQTLGPEALVKYIEPSEAIKRLAAAQGIDVLNLVKTPEQLQEDLLQQQQQQQLQSLTDQAGQLAGAPMMDPTKNPDAPEYMESAAAQMQQPTTEE